MNRRTFFRLLTVCLAALTAVPSGLFAFPASAATVRVHDVNGVNSGRGTDEMIIYDSGDRTNTNEWGYEVTVSAEGKVTRIGGNNSLIPEGGFVVSGHGESRKWLEANVRRNMYCFYNPYAKTVSFSNSPIEPSYSYTLQLTGVNTIRVTDALVLFNGNWGASTKTNEWGYEVSVSSEGRVLSKGGNNSSIPSGGYVLSAHGKSITVLQNLFIDEKIEFNSGTNILTVTYDGRCALGSASADLKSLAETVRAKKKNGLMGDFATAERLISEAEKLVKDTDTGDSNACFAAERILRQQLTAIRKCLNESVSGEYRGVWLRPDEKDTSQVAERVKTLKDAGVNMIAVEVLFGEGVIFPTPDGCPYKQLSRFEGFDILQAYVEECHKQQMEIHAWFSNLYAGNSPDAGIPAEHPEWLALSNTGVLNVPTEYGDMYFINPFCKEATDALLEMYRYVLTKYDLDAFQLDYIRYPGYSSIDFGYNPEVTAAFKKIYGVEPEFNTKASYWKNWCAFRAEAVTEFVRSVRKLVNECAPDTMLTADVFANIDSAPLNVYQDYRQWMQEGLLDMVHPMAYGWTDSFITNVRAIVAASNGTPVVPGTGVYLDELTAEDILDQILASRELGCAGTIHFQAIPYLSKHTPELLLSSVYSAASYPPHRDSLRACGNGVDILLRRASTVLKDSGAVSDKEYASLASAAETVRRSFTSEPSVTALEEAVRKLSNATARIALTKDLARLKVLTTFLRPTEETYVTVPLGTAVSSFAEAQGGGTVYASNGFPTDQTVAGTGMYVVKNGVHVTAVVRGDLNGDGKITAADYLRCKRHVLRTALLTGAFEQAALLSGKDSVTAADYVKIKRHVLKISSIE